MAKYVGGCLCGQVRYEIDAEPVVSLQCQCRNCQKRSGTGHTSFMAFPKAAVKLTGPLKYHAVKADSGHMASVGFCTECGSQVCGSSTGAPELVPIMAGSLDDPNLFSPQMVLFAMRASAWDRVDPALPKFPGMPPM